MFSGLSEELIVKISEGRKEPSWLLKSRLKAYQEFMSTPLEEQLFTKYVDFLKGIDLSDFKIGSDDRTTKQEPDKNKTFLQCDTKAVVSNVQDSLKNQGLIVEDIGTAVREHPEIVRPSLTKRYEKRDKFTALSDALFTSGLFIHAPDDLVIGEVFRAMIYLESSGISVFNRSIISIGNRSKLNLLIELYSSKGSASLFGSSLDLIAGEESRLSLSEIQLFDSNVIAFLNTRLLAGINAKMDLATAYFGGKVIRSRSDSILDGNGSEIEDLKIIVGSGNERYDLGTSILHRGIHTNGVVDLKAVMRDRSIITLKGMNKIEKQARNTNTYLGGHAILVGNKARANIIPGLEIDTNEVKAKHAAAVAQMDEEQVFYLKSRGLSRDNAIRLIVAGFLESIVRKISIDGVQDQIREIIDERWDGITERIDKIERKEVNQEDRGEEFVKVATLTDVPEGSMLGIDVVDEHLIVSNIGGKIYASSGLCTHEVTDLSRGFLGDKTVTCPLHLSQFDLETGEALNPPADEALKTYSVMIKGSDIMVKIKRSSS